MKDTNILIVGVGGQGVILASDVLSEVGIKNGYDVKKSDSLGMAQRGGSVISHVRWGKHVFSPMIKQGEVDFLIGFEKLEAARWGHYLKPGGTAIVADVEIIPVSVIQSKIPYPAWGEVRDILTKYTGYAGQVYLIPALSICLEVGNPRALNMVMLGALSTFLNIEKEAWSENLRLRLRPDFIESSLQAFSLGANETGVVELGR
jgi:indolepyruvate ferredoxin oxidoreductase beta subunit